MTEALQQEIRTLTNVFESERDPEGRVFAPLADAYRRAGEVQQAVRLLNEGLARHPQFVPGHVVAAQLFAEQGLVEEAGIAARRALDLDGENVNALRSLLRVLEQGGGEGAAEVRDRLVALDPSFQREREAPATVVAEPPPLPGPESTVEGAFGGVAEEVVAPEAEEEPLESLVEGEASGLDLAPEPPPLPDLASEEPLIDLDSLASLAHGDVEAETELGVGSDLAPELDVELPTEEPVLDLDDLAPVEASEVSDEADLAEPVGEVPGLSGEDYEEPVLDLADLAPPEPEEVEEPVMDLADLAPEPEEEPAWDLAALAPDEPEAPEEEVVDLADLAPPEPEEIEEPVVDLADLAPTEEEEAVELAYLAPEPEEEAPWDLAALAPDEPEASEEEVVDLADLAPPEPEEIEEPVMDLADLAPSEPEEVEEPVMDLADLAPAEEEEPVELAYLAPEPEEEVVDLADLAPSEEPGVDEEATSEAEEEVTMVGLMAQTAEPEDEESGAGEDAAPSDTDEDHEPGEPVYTRTLAELYVKQGAIGQAIEVYRHLATLDPAAADIRERIAELESGKGLEEQAEPVLSPEAEEEVEALARELSESGHEVHDEADSPFNLHGGEEEAEEEPSDQEPSGPTIGDYFEGLLGWEPGGRK